MGKNDGGPAFPIVGEYGTKLDNAEGMTLRDYMAAKAMQADISRVGYYQVGEHMLRAAKNAYEMADSMLAERNK